MSCQRRAAFTALALIAYSTGAMATNANSTCPLPDPPAKPPEMALSLAVLQAEARAGRMSPLARSLGGLRRIRGIFVEADDILLLGDASPDQPPLDIDDFSAVIRNAYGADPLYSDTAPGVTIDPMIGAKDPWAIQEAKVLGLPRGPMAKRFFDEDYLLKRVGAAIVQLPQEVIGTFALMRASVVGCDTDSAGQPVEVTHRFWFHARRPDRPRFEDGGDIVLVKRPIGVELLTEREFLSQSGQRQGATPASSEASQFAAAITCLLATSTRPEYVRMASDFALVELSRLLRYKGIAPDRLAYLLDQHSLREVDIPRYVGGIRRQERGEIVCDSNVQERSADGGTSIHVTSDVRSYNLEYRGGVDANIPIDQADMTAMPSSEFDPLRRRIRASRPDSRVLVWPIDHSL